MRLPLGRAPCPPLLSPPGLAPRYPLFQRVALMQLVRQVLADPLLTYHLFSGYDLSAERKLDAVQARPAHSLCLLPLLAAPAGGLR